MFWLSFLSCAFYNTIVTTAIYLHEPSHSVLLPPVDHPGDFGYSLAFFAKTDSLLVGAPHIDLDGAVYSCYNITKDPQCRKIQRMNLSQGNRENSPNQHYCLGASLSAGKNYFVTCASLLTKTVELNEGEDPVFGAYGTCFYSNVNRVTEYKGLLKQYEENMNMGTPIVQEADDIYGGVGWTTLQDDANNLTLFAKSALSSNIEYADHSYSLTDSVKKADLTGISRSLMYIGRALAAGRFVKGYGTVYAFSMNNKYQRGSIAFLEYKPNQHTLKLLKLNDRPLRIDSPSEGDIFGATLHGVNILKSDIYDELLVGAPAQDCLDNGYDVGAIYIYAAYEGEGKSSRSPKLQICGVTDGSRFGTAITSFDLDEDSIPEIIVSAPYEDSMGYVYIMSGVEISQILKRKKLETQKKIFLTELVFTQKIRSGVYKGFGFSLQMVNNIDENGKSALAVGSPGSGRVIVYKSITPVSLNVSSHLYGIKTVREKDDNFTVRVDVNLTYPLKSDLTNAKLLLMAEINGDAVSLDKSFITRDLSEKKTELSVNFTAILSTHDRGIYKFKVKAMVDEDAWRRKDYDNSLISLTPLSKTEAFVEITRLCTGEDCTPKLSAAIDWSGGKQYYMLGSTNNETVDVRIRNDGNSSFESCAWIEVVGAQVQIPKCDKPQGAWYRCSLFQFDRKETRLITISLDMSKPSSKEKKLRVRVELFNNCVAKTEPTGKAELEVKYLLNPNEVTVNSSTSNRNVTETDLQNENIHVIDVHESYTISNKGPVLWKSAIVQFISEDRPFIENFTINSPELYNCKGINDSKIECLVDIKPLAVIKVVSTISVLKKNLVNKPWNITTQFRLSLNENLEVKNGTLVTHLIYQNDITLGQNMNLVLIISCLVAALLLIIIIGVLFKVGFFRRRQKEVLIELRKELIQKNRVPQPESDSTHLNDHKFWNSATVRRYKMKITAVMIELERIVLL
ncbi:unnamed protein product [Leptidea sinapis]|uniref:Integrin alpha-2 domain-containing protein n=1 Tax=Leptidea sinapis TaxID=189913 RepID=A0A5E4PUL0_9NEOP|nr:unnamed protein product [Leptidea sinapis]